MSGLPTLLRKGFVIPSKDVSASDKKKIENTVSIDYIMNFISDRIPKSRNEKIKQTPKKYGDKVIALKAKTGSGKSTVLPYYLYKTFFERTKKNIAVTQPRILTAMDIPSTILPFAPELHMDVNIGYNTGIFKRLPTDKGIIFSTIGVLTQQLITMEDEDFIKKYQFIIIDEVHDRSVETDLCLFLLKKLIVNNFSDSNCPLIILTSATFNENVFINYFDIPKQNYIEVTGSTFPIDINYTDYSIANYIQFASLKAQKIHLDNIEELIPSEKQSNSKDIIIFVKDSGIGKKIYNDLHYFNSKILTDSFKTTEYKENLDDEINKLYKGGLENNYYILPIILDKQNYEKGGLEYQNLFSTLETINTPIWKINKTEKNDKNDKTEKTDKNEEIDFTSAPYKFVIPSRRIIIATNIAETGVTIPTLKYCIDMGMHNSAEFYPEYGCSALFAKNITLGMAIQRAGRTGRNAPGIAHRCYTQNTFDKFLVEEFSKIIISDSTENLLSILKEEKNVEIVQETSVAKIKNNKDLFNMFQSSSNYFYGIKNELKTNISALDFIELPSMQALSFSMEKLHILGYIDDNYDITSIGYFANQIRFINLECRKMIMAGYYYGANILDLITISAFVYTSKRKVFAKGFKLENFLKINNTDFQFYSRILIADDFINNIFVWNIFQNFIHGILNKNKPLYIEKLKKWCLDNYILYDGLVSVIAIRDTILENIITIGLDPYKNSLKLEKSLYNLNNVVKNSLNDGLEEIQKIKYCIFEGFKCNIFINKENMYYSLLRNIQVKIKSNLVSELNLDVVEQTRPRYIIIDSYMLSAKFNSAQFEFIAGGYVSVLDNFINVDEKMFLN